MFLDYVAFYATDTLFISLSLKKKLNLQYVLGRTVTVFFTLDLGQKEKELIQKSCAHWFKTEYIYSLIIRLKPKTQPNSESVLTSL